jgi:hypothetical protein
MLYFLVFKEDYVVELAVEYLLENLYQADKVYLIGLNCVMFL